MPTNKWHNRQTKRRQDMVKVTIEDVNLDAIPFPVAQGRDRAQSWALFDVDLSHGIGGHFTTPEVGEVWWIKRSIGSRWVLDHKVDSTRTDTPGDEGGGGGGGDSDRSDVPTNVEMGFTFREVKKDFEYEAFVTFDAVTEDENGDPANPEHYVVHWVPCTKEGNIIPDQAVRQHIWSPNDPDIDDPLDPAADYYVLLPGNVPRPKVWYWKARVRAVSTGGAKGEWSDWTEPALPLRDSLPEPPAPEPTLTFKWKDSGREPIFSAIVSFDDVNYWDIPGYDYEDDVTEYEIQLMPLQRLSAHAADDIEPGDGFHYVRADPNGDGTPWPVRRQKVKDKDDDDNFETLGTLAEDITGSTTVFTVDETGVIGNPATTIAARGGFIVQTSSDERWLVFDRTLVGGSVYTYEAYRQFEGTDFESHSTGASLEWLKDPYVYHVDFHHIERPRTVYWRARARSKDRFNRIGQWSDWTMPQTPWRSIDWEVPVPEDLRADIEVREHKTHPEYKLVAKFKDPAPEGWNLPGGDLQDDLSHYVVVAEALLPDPDGYIDGGAATWDSGITYSIHDKVNRNGVIYESQASNNVNHQPPNSAWWIVSGTGMQFIIPDHKIGRIKAGSPTVNPNDSSFTITLDADLPKSFTDIIDEQDKSVFYMRVQHGSEVNETANEVVAVEDTTKSGLDRTLTVVRAQKGSPNLGFDAGDFVYMLTEHRRRQIVQDKDEKGPGHRAERYSVTLGQIPKPRQLFWRVRAQSVDSFGHKSQWTPWTPAIAPGTDPDLIIDYPDYVALSFDKFHRNRHQKWRAIVEWSEVDYTAPDGDREPDVSRYGVQLATSDGDNLDVLIDNSTTSIYVNEMRKEPKAGEFYIMIDDEVMLVTARAQGVGQVENQWTYTVDRGQKGTTAVAHPDGALLFGYPYLHQTMSAKHDDDKNDFNRVPFPRAQKWAYYKARVRAYDRYNRTSLWSPWTAVGTPADNTPPEEPDNVLIDVDEHKVHITWDYATDPRDPDTELPQPDIDVEFFQVQLSTAANFNPSSLLQYDRNVLGLSKTWRLRKPSRTGTYYARVRAVDASGNKSAWEGDSGAQSGVPTPDQPELSFDTNEDTQKLRAVVQTIGVSILDDDDHDAKINGYVFELQPSVNTKLTQAATAAAATIKVKQDDSDADVGTHIWVDNEEMVITSKSGSGSLTWHVTRGFGSTTPAKHRNKARVYWFENDTHTQKQSTAEETNVGDTITGVFKTIHNRRYYRARVKAKDTQGRWGNYSSWSDEVRAVDLTPPDPPRSVNLKMQQTHVTVEWDTEPDPQDTAAATADAPNPSYIQRTSGTDEGIASVTLDPFDDAPIAGHLLYAIAVDFDNANNTSTSYWLSNSSYPPEFDKIVDTVQDSTQAALFQRVSDGTETGTFQFLKSFADSTERMLGWCSEFADVPDPGITNYYPNGTLTSPDVETNVENQVILHVWVFEVDDTGVPSTVENGPAVAEGAVNLMDSPAFASIDYDFTGGAVRLCVYPVYYPTTGLHSGLEIHTP